MRRYGDAVLVGTNGHSDAHVSGAGLRLLAELLPPLEPIVLREDHVTGIDGSWFKPGESLDDILAGDLPKTRLMDGSTHGPIEEVDDDAPAPEPQKVLVKAADSEQLSYLRRFDPDDLGASRALVDRHGDDIRNVVGLGFHAWNRKRWTTQRGMHSVNELAGDLTRHMKQIVVIAPDSTEYKPFRAYWLTSGNRIDRIVHRAESHPMILIDPADLDRDPFLLNCESGTIDLAKREHRPHRRLDLVTKIAPVSYNQRAQAPRWREFLAQVFEPNPELIDYVQRALGYAMTGVIREHVFFVCYGPSSQNGKTTLLETVRNVMGDYATTTNASNFMLGRSGRFDTADVVGARFVEASEIEKTDHLNLSLVKRITGGDKIRVERKFKDSFEYQPQCKVFLRTNRLPQINDGDDKALWVRMKVIPFDVHFGSERRDSELPEKLRAEYEGIFAWLVEGAYRYLGEGLGDPPAAVARANTAYQERENPLARFLSEECLFEASLRAERKSFVIRVQQWCQNEGLKTPTQKEVEEQLHGRAVKWGRKHGGRSHGVDYYLGVRVRSRNDEELDNILSGDLR